MGQCFTKSVHHKSLQSRFDLLEFEDAETKFLAVVPPANHCPEPRKSSDQSPTSHSHTTSLSDEISRTYVGPNVVQGMVPAYRQKAAEDKPIDASESDVLALRQSGIAFVCRKGLKSEKFNQDDFAIAQWKNKLFLGVFDGHGPEGHHIAAAVRERMAAMLLEDCEESKAMSHLRDSFESVHKFVSGMAEGKAAEFSGTTISSILITGSQLTAVHVGDSRIVLAKRSHGQILAEVLTRDHKPSLFKERERIERSGGVVKRLKGDIPYRVFDGETSKPGLSLSRAVGDLAAHRLGVTHLPEVACVTILPEHEFVLVCSDGVWEFITPDEAVTIIGDFSRAKVQEAADALANMAWRRWIEEEKRTVDDITVVLAYLP